MDRQVKGILGAKLGMTQVWDNNRVVPVTVVQAGPCVVTQVRTADADGYSAVQLGFGAIKPKQVTKPSAGHFERAGVTPRKHLLELRTTDASEYSAYGRTYSSNRQMRLKPSLSRPSLWHRASHHSIARRRFASGPHPGYFGISRCDVFTR